MSEFEPARDTSPDPDPPENAPGGARGADGPSADDAHLDEAPSLAELMEWSFARLAVEAGIGAGGGAILSELLAPAAGNAFLFIVAGAVLAPLSLLLTPVRGPLMYRAARYGAALAIMGALVVSFALGAEVLPVEELLLVGALLFAVGAVGHGLVAAVLDADR